MSDAIAESGIGGACLGIDLPSKGCATYTATNVGASRKNCGGGEAFEAGKLPRACPVSNGNEPGLGSDTLGARGPWTVCPMFLAPLLAPSFASCIKDATPWGNGFAKRGRENLGQSWLMVPYLDCLKV